MLSQTIQKKLNEQVQKEFYSAYLYLSMKAYFVEKDLDGFANFFDVQVKEERDHALKIINYIEGAGGQLELYAIDAPLKDFTSPVDIFKRTYEHEQFVTKSIYEIVNFAIDEKDHKTNGFLQWFVDEQVEEEATMLKNLNKLNLIGDNSSGLFMLDAELANRAYTPILQANA